MSQVMCNVTTRDVSPKSAAEHVAGRRRGTTHGQPRCKIGLLLLLCVHAVCATSSCVAETFDVGIYGATPGGIAAALAAGKSGHSVVLLEPTKRIGGMVTSGLSHTDFHSLESLSGAFLRFAERVEQHYADTYGANSPQVRTSFHGTFAEPKVNLAVFHALIGEHHSIDVRRQCVLRKVEVAEVGATRRIVSASFTNHHAESVSITAKIWIDATYEGDLMAAAGVPWTVGRESRATYSESLAPEEADDQLQAYISFHHDARRGKSRQGRCP